MCDSCLIQYMKNAFSNYFYNVGNSEYIRKQSY